VFLVFLQVLRVSGNGLLCRNLTTHPNPLPPYNGQACNDSLLPFKLKPSYVATILLAPNSLGLNLTEAAVSMTFDPGSTCSGQFDAEVFGFLTYNWSFAVVNGNELMVWDICCDDTNAPIPLCPTFACITVPKTNYTYGPGTYGIVYDTFPNSTVTNCNSFHTPLINDQCDRQLGGGHMEVCPCANPLICAPYDTHISSSCTASPACCPVTTVAAQPYCFAPTPAPAPAQPTPSPSPSPTPSTTSTTTGSTTAATTGATTGTTTASTTGTATATGSSTTASSPSPSNAASQGGNMVTPGGSCSAGGQCASGTCANAKCVTPNGALHLSVVVGLLILLL